MNRFRQFLHDQGVAPNQELATVLAIAATMLLLAVFIHRSGMLRLPGPRLMSRLRQFLHDFQELTGWLPLLVLITLAAFFLLPAIDPRSGIDGLADLYHALVNTVKLTMAAFGAWLLQRLYFRDLSRPEEDALLEREQAGDWNARAVIWRNRLEWLACFAFCFSALFLL